MEKITKREMYEALVNYANTGVMAFAAEEGDVVVSTEALAAFAENEIALLDAKAAKAKERAAVKRAEGDALTDAVREALTEEAATIADIAARIEGEDVTIGKVQFRLNQLAKNGEAVKGEITIPATEGSKARKVVSYAKA
jgi:chromosome segregation ATPase